MKKSIIFLFFIYSNLTATSCLDILKEGDKYLNRVPLCEATNEKHSNIANAYYKRYEICVKLEGKGTVNNFNINPFDDTETYDCKKEKR